MKVTSQGSALLWVMAMSGGEWRPTGLAPGPLEERRWAAATLLRQGQMTQAAIARHLGVSRASVCRWAAVLQEQGRRGLRARPRTARRARRAPATRPPPAPRRPSLVAARAAAGQGSSGSGRQYRALHPEAHRGT